jgi:hypothetical protein
MACFTGGIYGAGNLHDFRYGKSGQAARPPGRPLFVVSPIADPCTAANSIAIR